VDTIRRTIHAFAGGGAGAIRADNTDPTQVALSRPTDLFVDDQDTLYVLCEQGLLLVRIVLSGPEPGPATIVYPTLAALEQADRTPFDGTRYGRRGTPTSKQEWRKRSERRQAGCRRSHSCEAAVPLASARKRARSSHLRHR
jgi:hypothetical protein